MNSRLPYRVLVGLLLATICTAGCSRPEPTEAERVTVSRMFGAGSVVFTATRDGAEEGPADVWYIDLTNGRQKRFIGAESVPAGLRGIAVAPDGECIALTGDGKVGTRIWLWTQGSAKLVRLHDESDSQPELKWSPSGRYLMVLASGQAKLYERGKAEVIKLGKCAAAFWGGKGDSAITVVGPEEGACAVYSVTVAGTRKLMFKWPRRVEELCQSPNGRDYVFSDARGAYLVTAGKQRVLGVTIYKNDWVGFDFSYNKTGTRLAIFLSRSYGEPHSGIEEQLWLVNPKTGRKSVVEKWEDSALNLSNGVGAAYQHSLLGWMADGKTLVLSTNVQSSDGESLTSVRSDHNILSTCNPATKNGGERDLFDSGEGCAALAWLPFLRP